eukprot:366521-Chlamydomonas_euryale.AAC.7
MLSLHCLAVKCDSMRNLCVGCEIWFDAQPLCRPTCGRGNRAASLLASMRGSLSACGAACPHAGQLIQGRTECCTCSTATATASVTTHDMCPLYTRPHHTKYIAQLRGTLHSACLAGT